MKFIVTTKKGNQCHSGITGVMNNSGFSGVTITKFGMKIYVPKKGIRKDGMLKKHFWKRIKDMTFADALWLNKQIAA